MSIEQLAIESGAIQDSPDTLDSLELGFYFRNAKQLEAFSKAYQAQQGEAVAEVAPDGSVFWLDHNHCMIGAKLYTHPPAAEAEGVEG